MDTSITDYLKSKELYAVKHYNEAIISIHKETDDSLVKRIPGSVLAKYPRREDLLEFFKKSI